MSDAGTARSGGLRSGRGRGRWCRVAVAGVIGLGVAASARAQWEPYPWKNMPRLADGRVDLDAPARRTAEGKPDLSGFWMPLDPVKHLLNLAADLTPGSVPLRPWAEALYEERIDNNGLNHPGARCWPSGIPEKNNIPDGLKLVQTPDVTILLHESRTIYRQIFTDGRPLPKDAQPTWMGYSVGRWEGDTLVVDVTNFTPKTYFLGSYENLHLRERWTRLDAATIEYAVTIEDQAVWTRPWTVKQDYRKQDDFQNRIYKEPRCHEGNYGMAALLAGARTEERAFAAGRGPDPATKCNAGCGGFAFGFADTGDESNPLTR